MDESRENLCRAWLSCAESLTWKARERVFAAFPDAGAAFDGFSDDFLALVGEKAHRELSALRQKGLDKLALALTRADVRLCGRGDGDFPELLASIPDPPDLLFYKGLMRHEEPRAIAVVGSRRETRYGREQAFGIARDLARAGVTVVSGLARGIDTAAHRGALEGHGRTVAVLGSGIKNVYPEENRPLAEQIIREGGALVSEFHPTAEPLAFRFPFRNRLVSGLCQGVLLIEAREKSGTLITVGHALAQGREVFALPGQVDAPCSAAPHRLLREGARLVTSAADVLEDMEWGTQEAPWRQAIEPADLTLEQRRLYDALCDEPKSLDLLMEELGMSAARASVLVTQMELMGCVEALPGRMVRRAAQ